mgnify:CR=1 FL=1
MSHVQAHPLSRSRLWHRIRQVATESFAPSERRFEERMKLSLHIDNDLVRGLWMAGIFAVAGAIIGLLALPPGPRRIDPDALRPRERPHEIKGAGRR